MRGAANSYSGDGASGPYCGFVTWVAAVVSPECTEKLRDDAPPNEPLGYWSCGSGMFNKEPDRLTKGRPTWKGLVGFHVPVVVQWLANASVYIFVDKLTRIGGRRGKGAS